MTQNTPLLSEYGLEIPSGTVTTMTNWPPTVEIFSVSGFTEGRTRLVAVLEINWLILRMSSAESPTTAALIVDPDQDPSAFAVGECYHVASQRFGIRDILLELRAAVFAASDQLDEFYCFHSW